MFERDKTLEALRYFHGNVRAPSQIKLLKLLFYLDLVHFRRTGRRVTDLPYEAWPFGPVPRPLWEEIKDRDAELHQHFDITGAEEVVEGSQSVDGEDVPGRTFWHHGRFIPKQTFENEYLTRREIEIAELLSEIFYDANAEHMSEASHNQRGPWALALKRGKELGVRFPLLDLAEGEVGLGPPEYYLPKDILEEAVQADKHRKAI